jgi:hypothetical protein
MKNFVLTSVATALMCMFYSCSSPAPKEYKPIDFIVNGQDTVAQGYEIMNYWTFVPDSANPANKYSKIDSITKYGGGISYKIPDSLVGKELVISLKFKAKETQQILSTMVVSIQGDDAKASFYTVVDMAANMAGKINEWVTVSTEIIVSPDSNDNNNTHLTIYTFKPAGKGNLLTDDLTVSVKALGNIEDE